MSSSSSSSSCLEQRSLLLENQRTTRRRRQLQQQEQKLLQTEAARYQHHGSISTEGNSSVQVQLFVPVSQIFNLKYETTPSFIRSCLMQNRTRTRAVPLIPSVNVKLNI